MRKIVFLLFVAILILCGFTNKKEILIPNEAIRIRVIASSNEIDDQNIKSDVKNEVSNYIYSELYNVDNYEDANKIIMEKIDNIKNIIEKHTNDYEISYGENFFPDKEYKKIKYKKGYYKSLVIKLGKGEGNNFWCILFPPLCLIDERKINNIEYSILVKELLKKIK